jgi:hypothetical protein
MTDAPHMLKVTVELLPDGREAGRRVLATAKIDRVKNGALADYRVELDEDIQGEIGAAALRVIHALPRPSGTSSHVQLRSP